MIYVDDRNIPFRRVMRYHLTADTIDELHSFAKTMGIKRAWFHAAKKHPHYDITHEQRRDAIERGAQLVNIRIVARVARSLVTKGKAHAKAA